MSATAGHAPARPMIPTACHGSREVVCAIECLYTKWVTLRIAKDIQILSALPRAPEIMKDKDTQFNPSRRQPTRQSPGDATGLAARCGGGASPDGRSCTFAVRPIVVFRVSAKRTIMNMASRPDVAGSEGTSSQHPLRAVKQRYERWA
jgi:hypothetical protein